MSLFEALQKNPARVLFLSQENACRSQFAETFARAYGQDCMVAFSAGLSPTAPSLTAEAAMAEKGLPFYADQAPKPLAAFDLSRFDVIVNLSDAPISAAGVTVLKPYIPAAAKGELDSHRAVRDQVEILVRFLIEHFQRAKDWKPELNRSVSAAGSEVVAHPLPHGRGSVTEPRA